MLGKRRAVGPIRASFRREAREHARAGAGPGVDARVSGPGGPGAESPTRAAARRAGDSFVLRVTAAGVAGRFRDIAGLGERSRSGIDMEVVAQVLFDDADREVATGGSIEVGVVLVDLLIGLAEEGGASP